MCVIVCFVSFNYHAESWICVCPWGLCEKLQEASSYTTFRWCIDVLQAVEVDMILLENVDISEEGGETSNIHLILEALKEVGFACKCYKLIASDFALPQRRIRLFILGYNMNKHLHVNFDRIDQYLELCRISALKPATCINLGSVNRW